MSSTSKMRKLATLLVVILTACSTQLASAMQSQLPVMRPVAYIPVIVGSQRVAILGTECDSALEVGSTQCQPQYVLSSPASWLREPGADWRTQEAVRGTYDFGAAWTQHIIAGLALATQNGITPVLVIRTVPDWASANPGVPCGPIAPQYYAAFGNYVNAVIDAYHVTYVEIFNEPDAQINDGWGLMGCWSTGTAYVDMLKVIYPMVKAAHPQAYIIAPALMGSPAGTWMQQAIAAGIGNYSDVISFHAYQYYPATNVLSHNYVVYLHGVLPGKTLMCTECALALGAYPVNDTTRQAQANYLTAMFADCESDGMLACFWFRVGDETSDAPGFRTEMIDANGSNIIYNAFVGAK